jgi:ATP-binding cassette subfamily C (CFTR/MRP) protein 4
MLFLRHRYTRCLRDLKRIEGVTRSPIFSQLKLTADGLNVIRSHRAEEYCSNNFFCSLDDNTRAHYLIANIETWSAIRFDTIAVIYLLFATVLAMFVQTFGQNFSAADIALTLSYSLSFMGLFQWTIR